MRKGESMKTEKTPRGRERGSIENAVSLVLRIGVISSVVIIALGLALLLAKKGSTTTMRIDSPDHYPRSLAAVLSGLLTLDPTSILVLGALVLIATPLARVATSVITFALERDWLYVGITSAVLAILIAGLAIGRVAG